MFTYIPQHYGKYANVWNNLQEEEKRTHNTVYYKYVYQIF